MAQYIHGKNAIFERLKKGGDVTKLLMIEGFKDDGILRFIKEKQIEVEKVSKDTLDRLSDNGVHQGVLALIEKYEFSDLQSILAKCKKKTNPLLLILDGVEDPHNFGAILRSCDAVSVDGVIVPKFGSAPLNATVAKVSTGAIEHVAVAQVTNLTATIKKLKTEGFWVVGAEANGASDFRSVDYLMPTVVVMGSEGKGISRLVLEQCDFKVKIPMNGHVNSLNVSVATALILFQIFMQRNPI